MLERECISAHICTPLFLPPTPLRSGVPSIYISNPEFRHCVTPLWATFCRPPLAGYSTSRRSRDVPASAGRRSRAQHPFPRAAAASLEPVQRGDSLAAQPRCSRVRRTLFPMRSIRSRAQRCSLASDSEPDLEPGNGRQKVARSGVTQ